MKLPSRGNERSTAAVEQRVSNPLDDAVAAYAQQREIYVRKRDERDATRKRLEQLERDVTGCAAALTAKRQIILDVCDRVRADEALQELRAQAEADVDPEEAPATV